MSKKPHRTRPLDRDGDGRDGGSLPGNQTAPMAETHAEWTRNDAEVLEDLQLMDEGWSGTVETLTLEIVQSWTDADARAAQEYAASIVGLAPDKRPPAPDFLQPFLISKPGPDTPAPEGDTALDAIAEAEPDLVETARADHDQAAESLDATAEGDDPDPSDTFTPEEVAAGQTPVIEQEGEATTTAADAATVIDAADPLVTVDTDTAPVAVRLSELGVLVSSRRLYKTPEGYSATYSAPFIAAATVEGWVKAGLAETIPSAGNAGGVRATAEARAMAARLRREQQAEAA